MKSRQTDKPAGRAQQQAAPGVTGLEKGRKGGAAWRSIVRRIRRSDAGGEQEFARCYSSGIRLLFRRHLGEVGLDRLVEEAIAGAMEEIRQGLIDEPAHLVCFVRTLLRYRQEELKDRANRAPVPTTAWNSASAGSVTRMVRRMRCLDARERRILSRYYLHNHDLNVILAEESATREEFEQLRVFMRESCGCRDGQGKPAQGYGLVLPQASERTA